MDKFGLPQRTIDELLEYFNNGSDIDFAIWTDNHENVARILSELDDLSTPYMFDVTDYKTLEHQGMKNSIDKDGKLFYKAE